MWTRLGEMMKEWRCTYSVIVAEMVILPQSCTAFKKTVLSLIAANFSQLVKKEEMKIKNQRIKR